jgi:hypothetical protein
MTEKKKLEIIFAPGCFDNFEGTQEELDEMMAEINRMVESGEFFEKARPLSEETLASMGDAEIEQLTNALGFVEDEETTHRKLH